MKSTHAGIWFVLGAALLWGTTGSAQAFAPAGFDTKVIGTLRLLVGGVALMLLTIYRGEFSFFSGWNWRAVFMAAVFTAGYQLCFFAAVARTGVAVGTMVAIGSAPVIGGLLGRVFRGESLSRRWITATLLAIFGCALLSLNGGAVAIDLAGVILAMGAGAAYAGFTLTIKGVLETHGPNATMALVVTLGAVLLSPLLIDCDLQWLMRPRSLAVVMHLGLATMALSYWLFARGLRSVQVSSAVTLSLAEPLTATILGVLVLGEKLNIQAFFGIALIFTGLVALVLRRPLGKPISTL